MSLTAKETGGTGSFDPVPEGTYIARCVSVVDLGLQDSGQWRPKEKIYLGFEVPGERAEWTDSDGNEKEGPALVGQRYTNSLSDKAHLRAHLQSWRGKAFTAEELQGFDVRAILGVPCMISVTHNHKGDRVYANIASIMKLPKGTQCPDAETELLSYSDEDPDAAAKFDKLPEWMQRAIEAGRTTSAAQSENPASGSGTTEPAPPPESQSGTDFDDDIPF